jgi:hypothetical protein
VTVQTYWTWWIGYVKFSGSTCSFSWWLGVPCPQPLMAYPITFAS